MLAENYISAADEIIDDNANDGDDVESSVSVSEPSDIDPFTVVAPVPISINVDTGIQTMTDIPDLPVDIIPFPKMMQDTGISTEDLDLESPEFLGRRQHRGRSIDSALGSVLSEE
jgi:hypothetical protein